MKVLWSVCVFFFLVCGQFGACSAASLGSATGPESAAGFSSTSSPGSAAGPGSPSPSSIANCACSSDPVYNLTDIPLRQPGVKTDFFSGGNDPVLDDSGVNSQWYRVIQNGKQYMMVDSNNKPDYEGCSTYYPIYLQGSHPSLGSLAEAPVSAVACRRDYLYPCSVNYAIKIRRCDNEVQYYLSSTEGYNAYCFHEAPVTTSTTYINTTPVLESTTQVTSYSTNQASSERWTSEQSKKTTELLRTTMATVFKTTFDPSSASGHTENTSRFIRTTKQTDTTRTSNTDRILSFHTRETTGISGNENLQTPTRSVPEVQKTSTAFPTMKVSASSNTNHVTTADSKHKTTVHASGSSQSNIAKDEVTGDNNKIIIIMTVCMGLLVATIIGLVVVIIYRRRKAKVVAKTNDKTVKEDENKQEASCNVGQMKTDCGTNINPYERLGSRTDLTGNMMELAYDTLTPYEHYLTISEECLRNKDENIYLTLP